MAIRAHDLVERQQRRGHAKGQQCVFTHTAHIAPKTGHGRQDQRRAERQVLWPAELTQHPVEQHHAEQPGKRRGQAHGPSSAAKQANRTGVEP